MVATKKHTKVMARGGDIDKSTGKLTLADIPSIVKQFMPEFQQKIIVGSEEHWDIIYELRQRLKTMPSTYQTSKIPTDEKIVYLHYFFGESDWYIVEKDSEPEQLQAFGYVILNADHQNSEWGYISIEEIKEIGKIELDFYWEPIKFGELKKEWEDEEEEQEEDEIIEPEPDPIVTEEPEPDPEPEPEPKREGSQFEQDYKEQRQGLDEFFTPKWVAEIMFQLAERHGFVGGNCCEPSFGHGVFFQVLLDQGIPETNLYGFELLDKNYEVTKKKFPIAHLVNHNFEYEFAKNDKALIRDGINKSPAFQEAEIDMFIGNPPYGYHKSPYSYLWDTELQIRIEGFFIYLSLLKVKKGGLVVFIINSLWLHNQDKYNRQKERIYELGNLIDAYRLPSNTFKGENRDTSIATDIVVFRKK